MVGNIAVKNTYLFQDNGPSGKGKGNRDYQRKGSTVLAAFNFWEKRLAKWIYLLNQNDGYMVWIQFFNFFILSHIFEIRVIIKSKNKILKVNNGFSWLIPPSHRPSWSDPQVGFRWIVGLSKLNRAGFLLSLVLENTTCFLDFKVLLLRPEAGNQSYRDHTKENGHLTQLASHSP